MSIKRFIINGLLIILLSACKEPPVKPEPTRPAQVWRVQSQISEKIDSYSGEIKPKTLIDLSFRVAGKVVGRNVQVGDTVRQGQTLAQLDNEDSELAVRQTESSLDAAQSSLQTSQANVLVLQNNVVASQGAVSSARGNLEAARGRLSTAQGNLAAMQASLESVQSTIDSARATYESARAATGVAQAEVQNAQLEYSRSEKLLRQGYLGAAVLDRDRQRLASAHANFKSVFANAQAALAQVTTAQSKIKSTQAQIRAAQGDVEAARANVGAVAGQIKTAEAQVDAAQAQVEAAKGQVGSAQAQINTLTNQSKLTKNQSRYTELQSTVAGVVTETPIEIGQVVAAGQSIVKIAKQDQLDVHIRVSEQAIQNLKIGTPVSISLWAVTADTLAGKVYEIAPLADESRLWLVKIAITKPSTDLHFGMTAKVTFTHPLPKAVAWLPSTALFQREQQPAVWVVTDANITELTPIEVEQYLDGGLLVSGLGEGLSVVAAGVNRIHQGQTIIPTPYTGQARPVGQ